MTRTVTKFLLQRIFYIDVRHVDPKSEIAAYMESVKDSLFPEAETAARGIEIANFFLPVMADTHVQTELLEYTVETGEGE